MTQLAAPRTWGGRQNAQDHAAENDDDFVSADEEDPREQQEMYDFLDAVSVASPGLSADCVTVDVVMNLVQICQPARSKPVIFHFESSLA